MPRDDNKNNDSRGRRDRPSGGKGRSGAKRGPDKKFGKREGGKESGKGEGERRPYAGKSDGAKSQGFKSQGARSYAKKPYAGAGKSFAGDRPPRRDGDSQRPGGDRPFSDRPRGDRPSGDRPSGDRPQGDRPQRFKRDDRPRGEGGEKRPFTPRGDRGSGDTRPLTPREDRGGEKRPYTPRGERNEGRPAARFSDKKFGKRKPYAPRDRGSDKRPSTPRDRDGDKRPYSPRGEGFRKDGERPPRRDFADRGPPRDRTEGGRDRGEQKPWQKREGAPGADRGAERPRFSRSSDDRAGGDRPKFAKPGFAKPGFAKPGFDKPRSDKPREARAGAEDRPRFSRPREDRPSGERPFRERPKFDRPRDDRPRSRPEGRADWQEHPRSESGSPDRFADRPRRENEDESRIFAKRPAFGGRGNYRDRKPDFDKRPRREEPKPKKAGERVAKAISRAGLASRRDAEEWVTQGRVSVNGRLINSPALDVTANDVITVDGKPLPERERTRLFLYHKPRGLMTTHADPEGRPTVFDNLPEGLPRLISIGRLDFNTEGLLLLTNDGGLARVLELPETGWLRRYRVRAHGEVTQAQLDELKAGVEVDGVKYGSIDATLERDQGANVWLVFAIREGKNREVRNVLAYLGLEVNRLIRVSYGPFKLGEVVEGEVEEVKTRVLREQLGEKVIAQAGAEFAAAEKRDGGDGETPAPRVKKPAVKRGEIADRKGRRVQVQRTGSDEARARNEAESSGYGPPRRPKRGYHGKRDLTPKDE
jgi:23S rRNA pseudouridine2605 synthase